MKSMVLKSIPEDLHAQLRAEAQANFRTLNEEALARLQQSLDLDDRVDRGRAQSWVDEALASGPETPLVSQELAAIADRILRKK
jgi:hypothetical protein